MNYQKNQLDAFSTSTKPRYSKFHNLDASQDCRGMLKVESSLEFDEDYLGLHAFKTEHDQNLLPSNHDSPQYSLMNVYSSNSLPQNLPNQSESLYPYNIDYNYQQESHMPRYFVSSQANNNIYNQSSQHTTSPVFDVNKYKFYGKVI